MNEKPTPTGPDPRAVAMLRAKPKRLNIEARQCPDLHDAITAKGGFTTEARKDGNRVRVSITWPRKRTGVKS